MSTNRAQARTKIREILRDFYDTDSVPSGGYTSSQTAITPGEVSRYKLGDLLLINSELLKVTGISPNGETLGVIRGFQESTASGHSENDTIKINPEWSDRALNTAIDLAIGDTFDRNAGMWIETIDETLTTDTTVREYSLPAGLTYVSRIQIEDDDGFFHDWRSWDLVGSKIQFKKEFPDNNKTIRLIGTSYQALLSDDTTDFTLSDEQVQFIIYDAVWHAIQQRFSHRLKATEYSAAVNERAGQPNELINMVNNIRRTVDQLRRREFKNRMPEFATTQRRG